MQDRISTYPGRWKLTPVPGETNVYDFERADDPIVAGTPLNKATFLTDAAAAAIAALTGNTPALPTEALEALASVFDAVGVADVAHIEIGSYVGAGTYNSSRPNVLTFTYKPRLVIVQNSAEDPSVPNSTLIWLSGNTKGGRNRTVTLNGNTLSWYSTTSADYQLNISGISMSSGMNAQPSGISTSLNAV